MYPSYLIVVGSGIGVLCNNVDLLPVDIVVMVCFACVYMVHEYEYTPPAVQNPMVHWKHPVLFGNSHIS